MANFFQKRYMERYIRKKRKRVVHGRRINRKEGRKEKEEEERRRDIIFDLSNDCISHILSFTSPLDARVCCLVSSTFKSAADSDIVWEKFLPLNYKELLSRSSEFDLNKFSSKKHLYIHFCSIPTLIDNGNKSFNLDKDTGEVCLMIGSKDLTINWDYMDYQIDWNITTTPGKGFLDTDIIDFWRWTSPPHSRFAETIELVEDCWAFISGKINTLMLSPNTMYRADLVFKHTDYAYGLCSIFQDGKIDFDVSCVSTTVKFVKGTGYVSRTNKRWVVDTACRPRPRVVYAPHRYDDQFSIEECDWWEFCLGSFHTSMGGMDTEVEMIIEERNIGNWKGKLWKNGLIIQGIELRPLVYAGPAIGPNLIKRGLQQRIFKVLSSGLQSTPDQ